MTIYSAAKTVAPILVVRDGAMGDVLDTTPIVRRLRLENQKTPIHVCTHHSEVYRENPDIQGVIFHHVVKPDRYSRVINLNMVYERHLRRKPHIDCYSLEAFGDEKTPKTLHFTFNPTPPDLGIDYAQTIAIHPARSWPQRTLPIEFWRSLVVILKERGWSILSLGTEQDWDLSGMRLCNTRGSLTLAQQASAINACAAFICSDSGVMMLAQTTSTPVVALLTMTLPYMADRTRFGKLGWGFYPITASIPCVGCTHEQTEPNAFFACKFGHNDCVNHFDAETIAWKAASVARQHKDMDAYAAG